MDNAKRRPLNYSGLEFVRTYSFTNQPSAEILRESNFLYNLSFLDKQVGQISSCELTNQPPKIKTLQAFRYNIGHNHSQLTLKRGFIELDFESIIYFLLSLKETELNNKFSFFVKDKAKNGLFLISAYNSKAFENKHCWVFFEIQPFNQAKTILSRDNIYMFHGFL